MPSDDRLYGAGDVTTSAKEQRPPATVYVYVPAVKEVSRVTTLGPAVVAPVETASVSELHFEKERAAFAVPEPTTTVNVRDGFFAFSEPENVVV